MEKKRDDELAEQLKQIQRACRPAWLNEQLDKREAGGLIELRIDLEGGDYAG